MKRLCAVLIFLLAVPLRAQRPQENQQQWPATRTATGRVLDVLGEAIPAASVRVVVGNETVARTATDGEGIYHLTRMPASGADLHIEAPGKARLTLTWRGPTTATVRHAVLQDAGRLSGRLVDAGGRAAANATIVVVANGDSQRAKTDDNGTFELPAVPLTRVSLRAFDDHRYVDRVLRLVGDTWCDLELPAGSPALRTVRIDGLPAAALRGAFVRVTSPSLALMPNKGREPIGADGTLQLMLDEWAIIEPVAEGFDTSPVGRLAVGGGSTLAFRCTPAVLNSNVVELTGSVRTTQNVVVRNQRLFARDRSGRDLATADVDSRGNFRMRVELPPGRLCRIGMALDEWELLDDERTLRDGCSWAPVHDPSRPIELLVAPLRRIDGPVRTADGTLLALAEVVVEDPEFEHRALMAATCDRAGNCCFSLPANNSYELLAFTHDGHVCTGTVETRSGLLEPILKWTTIETGAATGTLVDAAGAPLPGVHLFFAHEEIQSEHEVRAGKRQSVTVATDRHGRFRCRGLPTGKWTLVALDQRGMAPQVLMVAADREVRLDLVAAPD